MIIELIGKQILSIHITKGQPRSLILISLILLVGSTNVLGLVPHSFTLLTLKEPVILPAK